METAPSDYEVVLASGLFDEDFYLRGRPDIAHAGVDPLDHFLKEGWKEDADPSEFFSTSLYRANYGDVSVTGLNPLLHYLHKGRAEGRIASPKHFYVESSKFASPIAPTEHEWNSIVPQLHDSESIQVDVFMKVDTGPIETACSLFSLLSSPQKTPYRLTLIVHNSAHETLSSAVIDASNRGLFRLEVLSTICSAFSIGGTRDIVVLSSGVRVHNDWLDRLRRAAYSGLKVATVTPFCNDAGFCSYPRFLGSEWSTFEICDRDMDKLSASTNNSRTIEVPVGSPACFYAKRDCLDHITQTNDKRQYFSVTHFEQWSNLLRAAGWSHVLAADIFVRRFAPASIRMRHGIQVTADVEALARKHRKQLLSAPSFAAADPIAALRRALDISRIRTAAKGGALLSILHSWGGGTEHHVQDLTRRLRSLGVGNLICQFDPRNSEVLVVKCEECEPLVNLPRFSIKKDLVEFVDFLLRVDVRHVHVHHLAGFPAEMSTFLQDVCLRSGLSYDVTVHDYMFICPRIFLADRSNVYCGEPPISVCEQCIQRDGSPFGKPEVKAWRARHGQLLQNARRAIVPNEDVQQRLSSYFQNVRFVVKPHPEENISSIDGNGTYKRGISGSNPKGQPIRRKIVLMGAFALHKGSALLERLAHAALRMDLPLDFIVLGYTDRDDALREIGNVVVTGPYKREEAGSLLRELNADLMFFASVIPETFSFTLSLAFRERQFPVAFDIGAIAQRIRTSGFGELLPLRLMTRPDLLAVHLAEIAANRPHAQPGKATAERVCLDFLKTYYDFNEWPPAIRR